MSDLLPASDNLYALGSATRRWKGARLSDHVQVDAKLAVNLALVDNAQSSIGLPSSLTPTGANYYLSWLSYAAAKLSKAMTAIYGMYASGMLDLYGFNATTFAGLLFAPTVGNTASGAVTVSSMDSIRAAGGFAVPVGPITVTGKNLIRAMGISIPTDVTVDTYRGLYVQNLVTSLSGTLNNNIAIDVENQVLGTTRKLLRLKGTTQSNVEVNADDPSDLGSATEAESQLLLSFNENGTVTVRKVRWKQQDQLAATDRVLIAA